MKTKIAFAVLATVFAGMFAFAMIMAVRTGSATRILGQEQSGWMMMCFISACMMLVCLEGGWGKFVLQIGCLGIAAIFAIHFLGGDGAFRTLIEHVQWVGQKLSKGYADTFH